VAVSLPDLTWMQDTALSLAAVGAVLSVTSVLLGLFSLITGKDHLPRSIRRLLWKVPASPDDHRTHGMTLMLNGAAVMMVELGVTAGIVGYHGLGRFAGDALFLITTLALATSVVCTIGAYTLATRTRYVSTRASTNPHPGIPSA
jgi:hypothetical protein